MADAEPARDPQRTRPGDVGRAGCDPRGRGRPRRRTRGGADRDGRGLLGGRRSVRRLAAGHFDVTSLDRANRIIRAIVGLDKPVVAGVNGVAAGVGTAAALACDLQVARESALLAIGFAAIGLMPDGGSSATIGASIGRARAMRLTLLAEPISARDAFEMGLISHCVGDEEYDEQLARVVRRLVRGAPLALAATKKAINASTLGHLGEALERERSGQTVLLRTADVAEGMAAFNAKRRPDFRGV